MPLMGFAAGCSACILECCVCEGDAGHILQHCIGSHVVLDASLWAEHPCVTHQLRFRQDVSPCVSSGAGWACCIQHVRQDTVPILEANFPAIL